MKRLIILHTIMLLSVYGLKAQIEPGVGLTTSFDGLGIEGMVLIGINEEWAANIKGAYFISDNNPSILNFDAHYLLTTAGDNDEIKVKAIGGFNYWSSGIQGAGGELGFNLGGNIKFPLTQNLDAFIEPKVTFVSLGDFFLSAGIYF